MHLNATKSPQSKHTGLISPGGANLGLSGGVGLATKPPTNISGSTVTRQMSTKTVNLKSNNFIGNNPFLSLNTNWMPNSANSSSNHAFNTLAISNKSNIFF